MADYAHLRLERDGAVAWLVLDRPERRNALTHAMMIELEHAFRALAADRDCRVVVLRGSGGHFCAGGDLDAMAAMPPAPADGEADPLVPTYRQFGNALLALNGLPQASIAVVEGSAVGGGFGMACCCDVVVLHENARFGLPEPKVGFIPSQIVPFIVRRIGEGATRDLAVTARLIDGAEAHRLGIGRYLCRDGTAVERTVQALIDDVLKLEPTAVSAVKQLVMACDGREIEPLLDAAAESLVGLLRRPQATEGIRHFMNKSLPPWTGSRS